MREILPYLLNTLDSRGIIALLAYINNIIVTVNDEKKKNNTQKMIV